MGLVSDDTIDLLRYYEDIVRKFYHEHYFMLVIGLITVSTLILLIPFGLAVRRADRETAEEKEKEKKEKATKGTTSLVTVYHALVTTWCVNYTPQAPTVQ